MRSVCTFILLLAVTAMSVCAQQDQPAEAPLTVRTTLVMVPVLVTTKTGKVVFELKADDFVVTDNGVPQRAQLDPDTDSQPLALAIVVETGGAGARHLEDYRQLDSVLDALIGNVDHRVALIAFDSLPHVLVPFTSNTADVSQQLANLSEGDQGAAILNGVAFAVAQLSRQPANYRRAILLLSETIDQGSKTTLNEALRLVSDTNTAMYSFAFSSTRAAVSHEASKLNNDTPGPEHGCFSKEGADAEYEGHYSKQVLDCISQLAPPLRLATMAFIAARGSLKDKTAETVADLAGGRYFPFKNEKDLKAALIKLSNDVPNYYVLSFRPTTPTPGIHALQVGTAHLGPFNISARREYWIDDDSSKPAPAPTPN